MTQTIAPQNSLKFTLVGKLVGLPEQEPPRLKQFPQPPEELKGAGELASASRHHRQVALVSVLILRSTGERLVHLGLHGPAQLRHA